MANYIEVPAADMEGFLQRKGFSRTTQRDEVVYIKRSQVDGALMLKVYTSIRNGSASVRGAGRDAVRVCVVWDDGTRSFGVGRFPPVFRVHSVQSVLERLEARLKEAAQRARDWLSEQGKSAERAMQERLEEKAEFAAREAEQERAAFMSDPDMRRDELELEAELLAEVPI